MRYLILLSLLFFFASASRVDAYIDPGTGSYLLQLLLAIIFGVSFGFKFIWGKIVSLFSGFLKKDSELNSGTRSHNIPEQQEISTQSKKE